MSPLSVPSVRRRDHAAASWRALVGGLVGALAALALLTGCQSSAAPQSSSAGGGSTGQPVPGPTSASPSPSPSSTGAVRACPADGAHLPFTGHGTDPQALRGTTTLAVPLGVSGAQLCRYGSTVVGTPARLVTSKALDAGTAARLLTVVNTVVPPIGDQLGHMSCPYAGNGAVLVRFAYPDGSTADVVVRLTGCEQATSAHGTMTHRPDLVKALRPLL